MADEPTPDPTPDPAPGNEGLSSDEVKNLIGEALDEKLSGLNFATKDDVSTLRAGILEDITAKIPSLIPAGSNVDEASLLGKVSGMLDQKLAGISAGGSGGRTARTPGSLGRWLLGDK